MTPYELDILLHFHVSPVPYKNPHMGLYRAIVRKFIEQGVIEPNKTDSWDTTPLGAAWLNRILQVKIPEVFPAYCVDGEFDGWAD